MNNENKLIARKRIEEILRKHGIDMDVGGCGCCGSPWVSFKYKGETIINDESDFHIDTSDDNTT